MSGASYFAVEKAIKAAIMDDSDLSGVRVYIEQDLQWAAESAPAVCIYATGRQAPDGMQRLAAGQRTDWLLAISLWCYAWDMETERAAEQRDSLIERVELALMRPTERTLGGACETYWLEGGEFISSPGDQGFLCAGEIALKVHVFGTL